VTDFDYITEMSKFVIIDYKRNRKQRSWAVIDSSSKQILSDFTSRVAAEKFLVRLKEEMSELGQKMGDNRSKGESVAKGILAVILKKREGVIEGDYDLMAQAILSIRREMLDK
jgi:hypothetical protein